LAKYYEILYFNISENLWKILRILKSNKVFELFYKRHICTYHNIPSVLLMLEMFQANFAKIKKQIPCFFIPKKQPYLI